MKKNIEISNCKSLEEMTDEELMRAYINACEVGSSDKIVIEDIWAIRQINEACCCDKSTSPFCTC